MLCFTRLVFFILSQITLGILCEQKDSQTIKIVNGFDTLRQSRGEKVEPNSLINEIFSKASAIPSNETENFGRMLSYNKEKYHQFMTSDQSGLFSYEKK
jgi:hypothetical protein